MAIPQDDVGEIKGFIVAEVQRILKPLVDKMDKQGAAIRAIYSDGVGGSLGYLERARAEDKEKDERLMNVVEEHGVQLTSIANFVDKHNTRDKEAEDRQLKHEERLRFWVPRIWGMAVGLISMVTTALIYGFHKLLPVVQAIVDHYAKIAVK